MLSYLGICAWTWQRAYGRVNLLNAERWLQSTTRVIWSGHFSKLHSHNHSHTSTVSPHTIVGLRRRQQGPASGFGRPGDLHDTSASKVGFVREKAIKEPREPGTLPYLR